MKEFRCRRPRLTEAGVEQLLSYEWPGNIRELRNVVERAVILARGGPLAFDLPAAALVAAPQPVQAPRGASTEEDFITELERLRRDLQNLIKVLNKTQWKVTGADGAAALLGMKPTTLFSRMKKLGLKRSGSEAALVS